MKKQKINLKSEIMYLIESLYKMTYDITIKNILYILYNISKNYNIEYVKNLIYNIRLSINAFKSSKNSISNLKLFSNKLIDLTKLFELYLNKKLK